MALVGPEASKALKFALKMAEPLQKENDVVTVKVNVLVGQNVFLNARANPSLLSNAG